jgi:hypothetical protein
MYSCSLTGKLSNCKRFPSSLDQQCAGGMLTSQGPENRGVLTFGVQSTCATTHNTRCEYEQLGTHTGEEYCRVGCHRGRSVPGDNRATDNDWIHSKHAECLPALRCALCTYQPQEQHPDTPGPTVARKPRRAAAALLGESETVRSIPGTWAASRQRSRHRPRGALPTHHLTESATIWDCTVYFPHTIVELGRLFMMGCCLPHQQAVGGNHPDAANDKADLSRG